LARRAKGRDDCEVVLRGCELGAKLFSGMVECGDILARPPAAVLPRPARRADGAAHRTVPRGCGSRDARAPMPFRSRGFDCGDGAH